MRLDELSADVPVNKATIYRYFASKEELCVKVLEQGQKVLEEQIFDQAVFQAANEEDALHIVFQNAFALQRSMHDGKRQDDYLVIATEHSSPALSSTISETLSLIEGNFAQIIGNSEEGQRPRLLARLLYTSMISAKIEVNPEVVLNTAQLVLAGSDW